MADGPHLSSEYTFEDKHLFSKDPSTNGPRVSTQGGPRRRLGTSQTPAVGNIAQYRRKLSQQHQQNPVLQNNRSSPERRFAVRRFFGHVGRPPMTFESVDELSNSIQQQI